MITNTEINFKGDAGIVGDKSLGNILFKIAGIIGIAEKNGYKYGFPKWTSQQYFTNPLPICTAVYKRKKVPPNHLGFDFGFQGFNYQDNIDLVGEFGSEKYFEHCPDLIRHYFSMNELCQPFKDCILMHYRNYNNHSWASLGKDYYDKALKKLPDKPIVVVSDNIEAAHKVLGSKYEYTSNSTIIDFYLLSNADYLVMANSTFSWWAAWLSRAVTIAPVKWYASDLKDAPTKDLYCKNWILIY